MLLSAISYSERFEGLPNADAAFPISLVGLICYGFWLFGHAVATLRCVFVRESSIPSFRIAHVLPGGIGPALSSLILLIYFHLFTYGIDTLPSILRSYRVAADGIELGEAVSRLRIFWW